MVQPFLIVIVIAVLFFLCLLPLLVGVYLVWKHAGILRVLGWLVLLVLAFYWFSWISPWYVIRGGNRVQAFTLARNRLGGSPSVKWMDAPIRLLMVPDEKYVFPEGAQVLVADLKAGQTYWQPKAAVNLDDTSTVSSLGEDYTEGRGGLSLFYAFPSKAGPQTEYSSFGFSLPQWRYDLGIGIFGESRGWVQQRKYFGWVRLAVRESESGPVVVELNQILLNAQPEFVKAFTTTWLPGGKFLIFEPFISIDRRVLALGPFSTSQDTQSKDNKSKE